MGSIGLYGVQPGLEPNYLQYQLSGRDLSQMQGFAECRVGFGLTCNKTGAVLEQLLESNSGLNYQQLLMQAAGGETNFQNFASFYNTNPNLSQVPYASFWRKDSPLFVDGYRYLLGQTVSRTPQEGLGLVTQNFFWAPLEGVGNSLDLRSGLLNLKYSFGRLLLEEVAKIPDWEQQIQSLNMPQNMNRFYFSRLSQGLRALRLGNESLLQKNILEVLSMPFSPSSAELKRPNLGIPREFDRFVGQDLPGNIFVGQTPASVTPEVINLEEMPDIFGDIFVQEGSGNPFPSWLFGGGGFGLLLLLLSIGGDSSSDQQANAVANVPPLGNQAIPDGCITPNGNTSPNNNQIVEVSCNTVVPKLDEGVKKVLEPSTVSALLLLLIFLWMVGHRQRYIGKSSGVC